MDTLTNPVTVYLAGAMRDSRIEEDFQWREDIIKACQGLAVFLNPMAGKSFNIKTKKWDFCGMEPTADVIVAHDFWSVQRADIVLFNFKALNQDYPMIGSLIEFGHGTASPHTKLLWSIIDADYTGHGNTGFKLHPFLEKNSAMIFHSLDEALVKVPKLLAVMSGKNPHFTGIVK